MENKTADIREYQRAYRKAHPKDKKATNEYMKNYIKQATSVDCTFCGGHFKTYSKYKHEATQKHLRALIAAKSKEEAA